MVPADMTLNKYSLEYSFAELRQMTKDFAPECTLGSGGFGAVYRGVQADGTEVAVKALEVPEEAGFEEEVRVLSKFRHPHLVILMGFARNGPQRFLVYELLAGGDAHKRLEQSNSGVRDFLWTSRVSVAFDAACGLSHLHHASPKVFHRDIKSANILLDRNGTAKMADFGLACLSHSSKHRVEHAAGTTGYACPLYAQRRVVTEGSEVYSFGMVLLELLTASPPAWTVPGAGGAQAVQFLACVIGGDVGVALSLADTMALWHQTHAAQAVAKLALQCIQSDEDRRPGFTGLVNDLRRIRDSPEPPVQPAAPQPAPQAVHRAAPPPPPSVPRVASSTAWWQTGQVAPAVPGRAEGAVFWSLDCTFAEGLEGLGAGAQEPPKLVHGGSVLCPLRVGRNLQEAFFCFLVPDDEARRRLSREHFEIWAEAQQASAACGGALPCHFFLRNLSQSLTIVNGAVLDSADKCARLHDRDQIVLGTKVACPTGKKTYLPLLHFRFSLAGSVLADVPDEAAPPCPEIPDDSGVLPAQMPAAAPAVVQTAAGACRGTSLAGDVLPRFLLEIGGSGLREGACEHCRLLVHGPLRSEACGDANAAFPRLLLGRAHCPAFWRRLLSDEAFQALGAEHAAIEAVEPDAPSRPVPIAIRSLRQPVLAGGCAEGTKCPVETEQPHLLKDGDLIVLVAAEGCSVCLTLRDLRAAAPVTAARRRPRAGGA